ncbi:calpain-a [Plakobranchus ocellatus]|uniref:Calpain-a n=1 Tax=Plakobranchus ocellatus TaxID=259542 RepID=A0AAV4CUM7_9GAST|nr:calpain-a [Plakobranchus ocellatus]
MSRRTRHSILPNRSITPRSERNVQTARLADQNYDDILRTCAAQNVLFEDPEFPATDETLFHTRKPPKPFVWKRPKEICDNPEFFVGGASRFDLNQGMLGDSWFLAAVASLAGQQNLLQRVVPVQSFTDRYCGLFRFQFWHQGEWLEVVVDDRLPTYNNKLVFLHSTERNEFWSALLEKAYAKLQGSYEALKGGQTSEAMVDFTGGVAETFDLKKAPRDLLNIMLKAISKGSLMGCSIEASPNEIEAKLSNGLIKGHAYSVTAVKLVDIQTRGLSREIPMVRVRNPWGNEREWNGRWSDKSQEWKMVPDNERRELGLTFEDDGEFWMMYQDFVSNFERLEICNLGPDSQGSEQSRSWEFHQEAGSWVRGQSAGGCRNFPASFYTNLQYRMTLTDPASFPSSKHAASFYTNPQYRMTLTDPDDEDDEDTCGVVIALMQKNRRSIKKEGKQNLKIGFSIYKLEDPNSGPLDRDYFNYHASTARSPTFDNSREVIGRFKLPPGTYVVVPSTFDPNLEAEFLLRIFTEKPFDSR